MCTVKLMTVQETADTCKVSLRTMFRWLAEGRLPAVRVGNITRIRRSDLETFLEEYLSDAPKKQGGLYKQDDENVARNSRPGSSAHPF